MPETRIRRQISRVFICIGHKRCYVLLFSFIPCFFRFFVFVITLLTHGCNDVPHPESALTKISLRLRQESHVYGLTAVLCCAFIFQGRKRSRGAFSFEANFSAAWHDRSIQFTSRSSIFSIFQSLTVHSDSKPLLNPFDLIILVFDCFENLIVAMEG